MICLNLTIFRPKLLNVTTLKQMVCPKRLKRNYFSNFKYDLLKLNYFSSKSLKRNYFEADHYFSEIRHFSHLLRIGESSVAVASTFQSRSLESLTTPQ